MIIIQIILIIAFVAGLVKFLANPSSYQIRAWKKILGLGFFVVAIYAVVFPESLNKIAGYLGVGRGADLLLYCLALAFVFVSLNLYVNKKQDQKRFTELVRKVAIVEAQERYDRRKRQ